MQTKRIPKTALQCSATSIEVKSNGENAKTAPFKMLARSIQPIRNHHFFGALIHDMAGMDMRGRNRIAIDWEHGDDLLGYANRFEMTPEGLEVSGTLIPFQDDDQAAKLIYMASQGVPLEASITWGGDNTQMEEVAEGETTQVNGYDFTGPGVIFRRWELRSIAICKQGYDQRTVTELSDNGEQIDVEVINKESKVEEKQMSEAEATAVEAADTNDTPDTEAKAVEVSQPSPDVEGDEQNGEALAVEPLSEARQELQLYMSTFGDAEGALMYAQGYSWERALTCFLGWQQLQIAELEKQITTQKKERGLSQPVQFAAAPNADEPQTLKDIVRIKKNKK